MQLILVHLLFFGKCSHGAFVKIRSFFSEFSDSSSSSHFTCVFSDVASFLGCVLQITFPNIFLADLAASVVAILSNSLRPDSFVVGPLLPNKYETIIH